MKTVIVRGDQNWFDVAVQELGTVEGVFGLLGSADVLSDYPASGRLLKITDEVLALEYEPLDLQSAGSRALSSFKHVTVLQDQSWFDVSVNELGTVEGVFNLLGSADVLSDYPASGRLLKITQEVLALEYEQGNWSKSALQMPLIRSFKHVTVLQDQSWFDLALQELGSIEGVFGLLNPSGDTLDVNPSSGREVKILASAVIIKNNTAWYQQHSIKPATGISAGSTIVIGSGIGYWAIEVNFVVQ